MLDPSLPHLLLIEQLGLRPGGSPSPDRRQQPDQLDQLELVERLVQLELLSGLSTRGIEGTIRMLEDPSFICLIALASSRTKVHPSGRQRGVVGLFTAMIVVDEAQIDNLAIDSEWRGLGIASRLVTAGLDLFGKRGATTAVLEVRSANTAASQLYLKSGFQHAGIRPAYYSNPVDDALVMVCHIGPES